MHAIPVAGHFGHKMAPKLRLSQLSLYTALTDIVEDHKRLITINNYISQDWNDFNLAVRISSLRFSFGRDWNDKFQLRCSNSTESDQSHARRPEDRNCHPVDRGRLRIPTHITNEMHEWVKTIEIHRIEMTSLSQRTAPGVQSRRVPL